MRWRPLWIALGWALVGTIVWLSLTPAPVQIDIAEGDKLGHFTAYGTLMFWFCQLYVRRDVRAAYAAGFALMGVALEFAQGALGTRTFEGFDMLANATGVLIGWALALGTGPRVFEFAEFMLRGGKR
jgi:VanZ family protein